MKSIVTGLVLAAFTASAEAKTVKMEVNGMVCAFCAQGIEKRLRAMAPTRDVFVSLENRIVAVALKDGEDIPDATLTTSMKEAGYDVKSVARVDDSLDAIRKAVKSR